MYTIMNLCRYRNVFGAPGEGVHSYRFLNIAVIDVVFTFVAAYIISVFSNFSFLWTSIILFLIGIFFHHIFCVNTTIAKILRKMCQYLLILHNYLLNISVEYVYRK
jgi:hypothetical protein